MQQLEAAAAAFRIYVIGDGRAASLDGFEQDLLNRVMQSGGPLSGQAVSERPRMNAGAVQRLIRINIPHAAQEYRF